MGGVFWKWWEKEETLTSWHRKLKGPHTARIFFKNMKNTKAQIEIQKEIRKKYIRSEQFGTLREDLNPASVRGHG